MAYTQPVPEPMEQPATLADQQPLPAEQSADASVQNSGAVEPGAVQQGVGPEQSDDAPAPGPPAEEAPPEAPESGGPETPVAETPLAQAEGQQAGLSDWLRAARPIKEFPVFPGALEAEKATRLSKYSEMLARPMRFGNRVFQLTGAPGELDARVAGLATDYMEVVKGVTDGTLKGAALERKIARTGMKETEVVGLVNSERPELAAQALAAGEVLEVASARVLDITKAIKSTGGMTEPEAMQALAHEFSLLFDLDARTRGLKSSELAEALKYYGTASERITNGEVKKLMAQLEDPRGMARVLGMLSTVKDAEELRSIVKVLGRKPNALVSAWVNGMVSGPLTFAGNIAGNTATTFVGIAERLAAGAWGSVRRAATGSEGGVYVSEGVEMITALKESFVDGLKAWWLMTSKGESTFARIAGEASAGNKFDMMMGPRIPPEAYKDGGIVGAGIDTLFALGPTRQLMAQDEAFKVWNHRVGLRAEAAHIASAKGLKGAEYEAEVLRVMNDPVTFKRVFEDAGDYAKYVTFQRDLTGMAAGLRDKAIDHPMLRMLFPFITAPVNMGVYTFEHTPFLQLASKEMREQLSGAKGLKAQDLAVGRMGLSMSVGMTMSGLVYSGYITGRGPLNPQLRSELEATGWKPYSIFDPISKQYVPYDRVEPLASWLGLIADGSQAMAHIKDHKDAQKIALSMGVTLSNFVNSKTFMRDVAGLVSALDGFAKGDVEGGGVTQYLKGFVGSTVPGAVAQTAQYLDPVHRDARTFVDAIYARIPGYSKDVPAFRDLYGRQRLREGLTGWAPDLVIPTRGVSARSDEPALDWMVKNNVAVMPMSRTVVGVDPKEIELDPVKAAKQPGVQLEPKEYDRWGTLLEKYTRNGQTLKQKLDELVKSPDFLKGMSHDRQELAVKQQIHIYRHETLMRLYQENNGAIGERVRKYYNDKADRMRTSNLMETDENSAPDAATPRSPGMSRGIARLG